MQKILHFICYEKKLYRHAILILPAAAIMLLSSCAVEHNRFFQGDVIGFSDRVKTSYTTETRGLLMNMKPQSDPYNLLTTGGRNSMHNQINNVERGENTTAYYAMELAAERVKYVRKNIAKRDPKTRYYIFLLTDGLDNASSQVAMHDKRILFNLTADKYQKRLQRKLRSAMGLFGKNLFEVYPLFYEGDDVIETKARNNMTDEQYEKTLQKDMNCFRFSSEGTAPELISASDFRTIVAQLRKKIDNSSYTFKIPKSYAGKEIRMTFFDKDSNKVELTAKLEKAFTTYSLKDVHFSNGVTTGEIRQISSDTYYSNDYMNTYFVIDDIRLAGIAYVPVAQKVTQEVKDGGYWRINSEYGEVAEMAINTYFILVIDGSRSLNGKNHNKNGFEEETDMAKKIMEILSPRR